MTGPATSPALAARASQNGPPSLSERFASGPSPRERFGLGVAVLLAGFACIWWSGVGFLVELQLREPVGLRPGRFRGGGLGRELRRRDPALGRRAAAAARPGRGGEGALHEARAAALEGVDRSPDDWRGGQAPLRSPGLRRATASGSPPRRRLATANGLSSVPIPVQLPRARLGCSAPTSGRACSTFK